MMIEKTKLNLVRNICVQNSYDTEELEADAGPVGSPLGSPAVQAIPKQVGITDTLRSKQTTKKYLRSSESHYLSLFWPRSDDNRLYLVMRESR